MRRSGKFYSRNEKLTLKSLGLTPAPQSGAGWIVKEDGENEVVMVQLKSTDSQSYKLSMLDMKKLEYNAAVSHKVPVFLVQFLKQDKMYAIVDINYLSELHAAITANEAPRNIIVEEQEIEPVERKLVASSKKAREKFFNERSEKFARKPKKQ